MTTWDFLALFGIACLVSMVLGIGYAVVGVCKESWSNWLDDQYEEVADRVVWKMDEKRGDNGRE